MPIKFVEVTNSRTNSIVRINAYEILRIDSIDSGVMLTFRSGDVMPIDNSWADIEAQLNG